MPTHDLQAAHAQLQAEGWCVVADVLSPEATARALERLWSAARTFRERGRQTHMPHLDPNASNVRVLDLLDIDPEFRELIRHPLALELVRGLLGDAFLVSNFTANIARPGARSMSLHSDQALVVPEPWLQPWSINIIWCLTDVHRANGATLYVPGSQRVTCLADLGPDPGARLVPFEAEAGSIIAVDGRIWHTSGQNTTADQDRALLFGYYSRNFLRGQVNWNAALSAEVQRGLDPQLSALLGLEAKANTELGAQLLQADLASGRR